MTNIYLILVIIFLVNIIIIIIIWRFCENVLIITFLFVSYSWLCLLSFKVYLVKFQRVLHLVWVCSVTFVREPTMFQIFSAVPCDTRWCVHGPSLQSHTLMITFIGKPETLYVFISVLLQSQWTMTSGYISAGHRPQVRWEVGHLEVVSTGEDSSLSLLSSFLLLPGDGSFLRHP